MNKKQTEVSSDSMQFGLLGETLKYSKSPQIHSSFYNMCQINARYSLLEVPLTSFGTEAMMAQLKALDGFNVTIPYKEAIIPFMEEIDPIARRIGAVNTVKKINDYWIGYNTDYYGFLESFKYEMAKHEITMQKSRAIILGSGGAAKMVVVALEDLGYNEIVIVSRNPEKIVTYFPNCRCVDYVWLNNETLSSDLLINCTPIGHKSIQSSELIGNATLKKQAFVFDLNYSPIETELLIRANALGRSGCNGLYMLVAQALKTEEIWLEKTFDLECIAKSIFTKL
ncbi:shikimate dehydrogenase family protein [Fusibacter bizertensis]